MGTERGTEAGQGPSVTPGQTSAQDRWGSRARPSGSGAHREPGSFSSAWRAGRGCGACFHGVTGLMGRALGRRGAPAPPPTPEGVSAHDPVHSPSVSAWISHDSSDFWKILEGSLDPSFQRCCILRTIATASAVLPGGTTPATHHTPCSWAWLVPGSWDGLGAHSARGCPPAWCEDVYTPASPTDVCFLHRSEQMPSRRSPASAGRAVPYGGCLVRWSPTAGSCGDRPPPQAQHCGLCTPLSHAG